MPTSPSVDPKALTCIMVTIILSTLTFACGGGGSGGDDSDEISGQAENSPDIIECGITRPGSKDFISELQFDESFVFQVEVVDENQDADELYISSYFPSDRSTPLVEPIPLFLAENVESQVYTSVVHKAGPYLGEYRIEFYVLDLENNKSSVETIYLNVVGDNPPVDDDLGTAPLIESIQTLDPSNDQSKESFAIGETVKFRIQIFDPDIDTDVVEWMGFFPDDRITDHFSKAPFKTYQDEERYTFDHEEEVGMGSYIGGWRFEFLVLDVKGNRSNTFPVYLDITE